MPRRHHSRINLNSDVWKILIHGVALIVVPLVLLYMLSYFISDIINFYYPIGYGILIGVGGLGIPFVTGVINHFITQKLYSKDDIHMRNWLVYGILLVVILFTFKNIGDYSNIYVEIVMIPIAAITLGLVGRSIRED